MKKVWSLFCAILMMGVIFCQPLALAADTGDESRAIEIAKNWVKENYEPFYNLQNLEANIVHTFSDGTTTEYIVAITVETQIKADSVYDLPYVQGLIDASEQQKGENKITEDAVNDFVAQVDFSKEYTFMSLDLVIPINHGTRAKGDPDIYFQDGLTTTLHPVETLEMTPSSLYQEGKDALAKIEEEYQRRVNTPVTLGYSSYDRIAARDYAQTWTGKNITDCYDDGTSCGILQDRTQWNNSEYPYNSNFKHNDCADFVSQCICAGGIDPDPGMWERNKDGDNGWAWTSISGLTDYMIEKGYFDEGEFETANAGNILLTSPSHVVLITLNDTYTHRYTGHTNDRLDQVFYDSAGFSYYTIKT